MVDNKKTRVINFEIDYADLGMFINGINEAIGLATRWNDKRFVNEIARMKMYRDKLIKHTE